ncbi:hypothetical protein ACEQ8H_000258 [Pleosporales sp. CAS-2024a]
MSVRGARGRGRGSGTSRGRGRGGRTTTWEWHNNHSPGPEIYDQLWHVRQEPVTVTPFLPTKCPLHNARSHIVDRRQTEGDIQRNFYVVQVTYLTNGSTSVAGAPSAGPGDTETLHVDLSRILNYVSPDELERFENEQFRVEAEADAVARRTEAQELARRRLERNARVATVDGGHDALGGSEVEHARRKGRPRGRGRGRGRGNRHPRPTFAPTGLHQEMREDGVHVQPQALVRPEQEAHVTMPETASEDDDDLVGALQVRTSPKVARSAFVANSALPVSPAVTHRHSLGIAAAQDDSTNTDGDVESDMGLVSRDTRSMSSAEMQLRNEEHVPERSDDTSAGLGDGHRIKRRRSESTKTRFPSGRRALAPMSSKASMMESPGASDGLDDVVSEEAIAESSEEDDSDSRDEDAEEYVVESIMEHYRDSGKKYYLVKWQGYEDSFDWLPEENLAGAAEMVAAYNEKVRRKKKMGSKPRH